MKFRKKPVVIEAIQFFNDNIEECLLFCGGEYDGHFIIIKTLEGKMLASGGDWIIKGVKGEYYPCKPEIFEATYESESVPPQHGQEKI